MSDFMLSAQELADFRADILVTLPDTCTILRATLAAPDAYGDVVPSAGTAAASVACRIDPFTRQDSSGMVAGREDNRAYFTLTVPWNATIADGDQVLFGGDVYEVMQLHATHSDRAVKRATLGKAAI